MPAKPWLFLLVQGPLVTPASHGKLIISSIVAEPREPQFIFHNAKRWAHVLWSILWSISDKDKNIFCHSRKLRVYIGSLDHLLNALACGYVYLFCPRGQALRHGFSRVTVPPQDMQQCLESFWGQMCYWHLGRSI